MLFIYTIFIFKSYIYAIFFIFFLIIILSVYFLFTIVQCDCLLHINNAALSVIQSPYSVYIGLCTDCCCCARRCSLLTARSFLSTDANLAPAVVVPAPV